jgi:Family of unknown function (DUF5899)
MKNKNILIYKMDLALLSIGGLAGYLYNQRVRQKNFVEENSVKLNNYKGYPQVYDNFGNPIMTNQPFLQPMMNDNRNAVCQQKNIMGPGISNPGILKNVNDNRRRENFVDMDRSIKDFQHNNMVPFFGSKVTQSMAGTDVKQGNYIDGVTVDTGTDKTTPYQTKLASFTGIDDTYLSKRESGPSFSPAEQQQNWTFGQPLFREDSDYYTRSMTKRNDLKPVQSEMVGPGLNLDPRIPASGGFHDFTRVMPNNVSDYKANQLEGRVNGGKLLTAGLPESYPGIGTSGDSVAPGVPKNRPPRDYSMTRRPLMTTKAGFVSNLEDQRSNWDVDKRPKNAQRNQISFGLGSPKEVPDSSLDTIGFSPSRPGANINVRSDTYMSQDNNIRSVSDCNSTPLNGPSAQVKKTGPLLTNYHVNETDRGSINPAMIEQLNLKGNSVISSWNHLDGPKTTMKETNEFSYSGDPNSQGQGSKTWKYVDGPKTTMKETNEFSYTGDPNNQRQGSKTWKFEDKPKATIKQSTAFSYTGNNGNGSVLADTSRFQYLGPPSKSLVRNIENLDFNELNALGGADTYTIRGSTLVQDYMPGPGRQNILQDPIDILGKTEFHSDLNENGPGTISQAIPNASNQQNSHILSRPTSNPNKLFGVDQRQIAGYQTEQLKKNPLYLFTNNPDGEIPPLYADNSPSDYSDLINREKSEIVDLDYKADFYEQGNSPVNVYGLKEYNPNMNVVYNGYQYNPMTQQGSSDTVNINPTFGGKAYSGNFEEGNYNAGSVTRSNEFDKANIYGPTGCGEVNDALSFTSTLILK